MAGRVIVNVVVRVSMALAALATIIGNSGCTRNNGDIGDWFGTWQMTAVAVDGIKDEDYARNVFWRFQNNIIALVRVGTAAADHNRRTSWGTWSDEGDRLLLDFSYSDENNSPEDGAAGNGQYAPLTETHLPYGEVSTLVIESRNGGSVTLRYVAHDGVAYTYFLEKE